MEHNKGPWFWTTEDRLVSNEKTDLFNPAFFCDTEGRRIIVETDGGFYPPSEKDRPLLAAAPDLLNAARQTLSDLKWLEGQDKRNNFQASIILLRHAIDAATQGESKC